MRRSVITRATRATRARATRARATVAALLAGLALSACAVGGQARGDQGELTVFAAASLRESFTEIAELYEQQRGAQVRLNFAGSTALEQQLRSGAPADVVAFADWEPMDRLLEEGLVQDGENFAINNLVLVVPTGNPALITTTDDLARPGVTYAACAKEVPCGRLAAKRYGTDINMVDPTTLEPDVKAVLTKVALGEVDAGFVYLTDALAAADRVELIDPEAAQSEMGGAFSTTYPIAVSTTAQETGLAEGFMDFVLSDAGRTILLKHGFKLPE